MRGWDRTVVTSWNCVLAAVSVDICDIRPAELWPTRWMKTLLQSKEIQEAMDPLTGSQAHPPAPHSLLVPQVPTKYAATSTPR